MLVPGFCCDDAEEEEAGDGEAADGEAKDGGPCCILLECQALGSNLRLIVMGLQKSVTILQCYVAYIYSASRP